MVLSYSITKGIGVGLISYSLMSIVAYVIEAIKYAATKKKNPAAEKPVWSVSIVALIVTALFLVYFFVPTK
jgi:xanthine/uracil/vitamin C permease (AzgA family)